MMDAVRAEYLPRCDVDRATVDATAAVRVDPMSGVVERAEGARCAGLLFLQVPVGPDAVAWNLHRRYGRIRLPLMHEGYDIEYATPPRWKFLTQEAAPITKPREPVFVLRPQP